ncbi:MAG TPA: VPLPA-CTERM-specific exosortase XrtD [Steroidobacteraceae bacterium]|nr:VPLPA-CTERM-specific exosortase XrtD [Steroidobacteraceae bacterium]
MHALRPSPPVKVYALLAVVAVAAVVPFARVLGGLYNIWNLKPEYSHGIIIPLLSAFLIWRQRDQLRGLPLTGSWTGLALIAAGLALRFIGERTTLETIEHYAFLVVLYGLVLALTGPAIFRRLWMPLLILVFAVPLPNFFNNTLSLQLQFLSSVLGVWVIRAAGISVLLEGNIIDLGNYQLEVAEACSGLRYLFPLMTLAFIVSYMFRGPVWKRTVIFLSSIPITVLMNSLRIGFIGITVERWGTGMAEGALHDFEGWLVFMFSTGALVLTAIGLSRVGPSRVRWRDAFSMEPRAAMAQTGAMTAPALLTQPIPRSFLAAAVLVLLGAVLGETMPTPHMTLPARTSFYDFPSEIGAWSGRKEALESKYLDILRLDDYVIEDFRLADGPPVNFYAAYYQTQDYSRGIHSPHDCIPGGGWEITKLEQRTFPATATTAPFQFNRAIIQLGATRQIVYYWFEEHGRHVTNEYLARWYLFWDAFTRHRTDGALVRFIVALPAGASEVAADEQIMSLAARVEPTLSRYVPN